MSFISKIIRLIRSVFYEELADVHTHLPAKIVSYNATTNLVSIQPCIDRMRVDDPNNIASIHLPQIDDVPVHHFGSGKCLLTVAPQIGSYGSYHVSERSLTKWISQGGIATPENHRMFDISSGFFVPGIYPQVLEGDDDEHGLIDPGISQDRIELRTRTQNTFVSVIDTEDVAITAGNEITFNSGTDYAVRYNELETAFNDLKADFNNLVAAYNLHVHVCAAPGAPSATPVYAPVPPGTPTPPVVIPTASTANITGAKIPEIRMPEKVLA